MLIVRRLGFDAMSSDSEMEKSEDELSSRSYDNDSDEDDESNFLDSHGSTMNNNESESE